MKYDNCQRKNIVKNAWFHFFPSVRMLCLNRFLGVPNSFQTEQILSCPGVVFAMVQCELTWEDQTVYSFVWSIQTICIIATASIPEGEILQKVSLCQWTEIPSVLDSD